MGFLDNLFGAGNAPIHPDWKVLSTIEQLDEVVEGSKKKPVVLFKHSTTCGISAGAKHALESKWDFAAGDLDFYYLDLLNLRPISNEIASRFGVIHQSPQIIVIADGKAVFDTSHHRISADTLRGALESANQGS